MSFSSLLGFVPRIFTLHLALAALGLAGCASPGVDSTEEPDDDATDSAQPTARDAGKAHDAGAPARAVKDAGAPSTPSAPRDAGSVVDAGVATDAESAKDPLADLGKLGADIDWDAFLGSDGGLSTPPGPASPDNPKECPATAPENPVGSCIGVPVYATCKYGDYTCLCDWIHWLCI